MTLTSRLARSTPGTVLAVLCALGIGRGDAFAFAWFPVPTAPQSATAQEVSAPIPADQLDSLVAPIALYPDPLLAQVLAASTYPLEIMQLQQWLTRNPGLQGQALAAAVAKQPWDPSVQAMAVLPDVVKRLADNIQWTTDLGNAFLAQESDTMNAVQRMRQKAEGTGSLQSTPQQVVETRVVEDKSVIVIEPSSPDTVYVPSYNPTVVYGAEPAYAYPAISYPSAGYYAAGAAISFGLGVAAGAFWGGGGWGWNAGWGRGDINVNRNNAFVRNSNFNRSGAWQHNAVHRGAVGYGNRATAARYGGSVRGASMTNRAGVARQQINRQGGNLSGARAGALGTSGRTLNNRPGTVGRSGAVGTAGLQNRPGTVNRGNYNRGNFNRGSVGTTGLQNRPGTVNRGNYNRGNFNRGSVGTTGLQNRSGNINRGNFNRGNFNRGNFSGSRGSFSGSRGGSFSGGRRGGGGFSGGGGRRGGGGGRRGGGRR